MRQFTRFITFITFCFIFVFGAIQAQEETFDALIYFEIYTEIEFDENILEELVHSTQEILAEYNITLQRSLDETDRYRASTLLVDTNIVPARDNALIMWTSHNNIEVRRLSPILYDTYLLGLNDIEAAPILFAGLILYNLNNLEEAKSQFLSILPALSPGSQRRIPAYFYLGNIALLQGDYETALQYFAYTDDSLDEFQEHKVTTNTAWLHLQSGNTDEVIRLFNEQLAHLDSERMETYIYSSRAQIYALMFDYDSAIADMDEAIAIAEENELHSRALAQLHTIRGEIIFLIYEWDRVEDNFNTAIELDPTYAPAYFQRGVLFYTMARREDALADFETYLELEPDGIHAEEAQSYIDSIEIELEALNG